MNKYLNEVWCMDARRLLAALPSASIDLLIPDAMYGTTKMRYDTIVDPGGGNYLKHYEYNLAPFLPEFRRVLKPGGVLCLAQGFKFDEHLDSWFGHDRYRIWTPICSAHGLNFTPNYWLVMPYIEHPNHMYVRVDGKAFRAFRQLHPCPKPLEEMRFMLKNLARPGATILDCFSGLGTGLVAAELEGMNWIGCDKSRRYCQIAMKRLDHVRRFGTDWMPPIKPLLVSGGNPDGQCYQTPPELFSILHNIFRFTVDAAASLENALLPRYWDEEKDALAQDWSREIVYCNPPFNNVGPFLVKARTAVKSLVLAPLNYLTSRTFNGADFLIIPERRVRFVTGKRKAQPMLGTCFLLYGEMSVSEASAIARQGWKFFHNHEAIA